MPSAHKNKEDIFISAFYENKEFENEDNSEGFSSEKSDEMDNFKTPGRIETYVSPAYDDY